MSYTGKACPNCGCDNCQIISESTTEGGKYGFGKGCCGYIIFGWIGLLCGLCGMESKTSTKSYWICPQCSNKFKV